MKSLNFSPPRRLIHTYDLLYELVSRDMKIRYKRSVLGFAWSLLNPLAQLLVLYFVFNIILPVNIPNYSSYLFTGLLPWTWFQATLLLSTNSIVENRDLIKRPGFPTAILPIVTSLSHLIHFLLAIPVLLVFLIIAGTEFRSAIITMPLLIAIQFVFILSLGYLISTLHVIFRDTQYLLGIFLQLLIFVVPVFYDISYVPDRYKALYKLNPLAITIHTYRVILIEGRFPELQLLIFLSLFDAALLLIGYTIFKKASHRFVEEL